MMTESEIGFLLESALRVLEEVCMRIQHPEALGVLRDLIRIVDSPHEVVKFPRGVVGSSIRRRRRDFLPLVITLETPGGLRSQMPIPRCYAAMYFTTMPVPIRSGFDVDV